MFPTREQIKALKQKKEAGRVDISLSYGYFSKIAACNTAIILKSTDTPLFAKTVNTGDNLLLNAGNFAEISAENATENIIFQSEHRLATTFSAVNDDKSSIFTQ